MVSPDRLANLEDACRRERWLREDAEREVQQLKVALAGARAERNIAVNAAASKIPDFDVRTIAVQVRQREAADSRARTAELERDDARQRLADVEQKLVVLHGLLSDQGPVA